jgi:hypothetical protein
VAQDRALQRAIDELPAQDRSFRVDIFGLPIQQPFARDDHARARRSRRLAHPGQYACRSSTTP